MDTKELITQAYLAFNKRDIAAALTLMAEDVSWPKASEGGRVVGKENIREYWTRQWADFDPRVTILDVIDRENGTTEVKVHQLVQNLKGDVLSNTELRHVYTIHDSFIERMDILGADGGAEGLASAFAHHDN